MTVLQSSRVPQTLSFSAAGPDSCVVLQQTLLTSAPQPASWTAPLERLRDSHPVTFGSCIELSAYQEFVAACVKQAQELVLLDAQFSQCRQTLLSPLSRAHDLVRQGKTSMGRELAVSLLGYHKLAQLAEQLKLVGNAKDLSGAGATIFFCVRVAKLLFESILPFVCTLRTLRPAHAHNFGSGERDCCRLSSAVSMVALLASPRVLIASYMLSACLWTCRRSHKQQQHQQLRL